MTRLVLSTALILEAAQRGRFTLGPLGVQLDGRDVDDHGGQEVIDLLDAGYLAEDGERLTPGPPAGLTPLTADEFLRRWAVAQ